MTKSLRKKLDTIDEWLLGADGQKLMSIIGASRGPDNGSEIDKATYTSPIRKVAFPKTWISRQYWSTVIRPFKVPSGGGHYKNHIISAADALGVDELEQASGVGTKVATTIKGGAK